MKRLFSFVFVLFLFLCASHVFSQTIGITAGILGSNFYPTTKGEGIHEDWIENNKMKSGYSMGIRLNFKLPGEDMSIESSLMYANLGAKYSYPDGPNWYSSNSLEPSMARIPLTLRLNYVILPVLFRYNLSPKISFKMGSQLGFLFSNQVSAEDSITEGLSEEELSEFQEEIDLSSKSKFDYGVNAGLGYNLSRKFDLYLNFYNGFSTVKQVDCSWCTDKWVINFHNRCLSLSVNYILSKQNH